MKIIRDATVEPWSRQRQCESCDSILLIEEADLQYDAGQEYPTYWPERCYISCPVCRDRIELLNSLPMRLRDKLRAQ